MAESEELSRSDREQYNMIQHKCQEQTEKANAIVRMVRTRGIIIDGNNMMNANVVWDVGHRSNESWLQMQVNSYKCVMKKNAILFREHV